MEENDPKNGHSKNGSPSSSAANAAVNEEGSSRRTRKPGYLSYEKTLHDHAAERAADGGDLEPDEAERKHLQDFARAKIREQRSEAYDAIKNPSDRMREREHELDLKERAEAKTTRLHAIAARREAEAARANATVDEPEPRASTVLTYSGAAFIGISITPAVADGILGGFLPALIAWTVGAVVGGLGGIMLARALLDPTESDGRRDWTFLGGVALGIALGVVRLGSSTSTAETILSVGLSLLEIATVVILEQKARTLRAAFSAWKKRKRAESESAHAHEATVNEDKRSGEYLSALEDKVLGHVEYVEDRNDRARNLPERETAAAETMNDGYGTAISKTRGRVRGVKKEVKRHGDE